MKPVFAFWRELEQRGVLAAVLAYAVIGFVVLLAADVLGLILPLPVWLHPLLIKSVLIGFLATVVLSWHFDLRRDVRPVGGRDLDGIQEEERMRGALLLKMSGLIAGVLVLTFSVGAFRTIKEHTRDREQSRIVIAPLENRTGKAALDGLGPLAADWITQRLVQTRQIEIVPAGSATAFAAVYGLDARQTRLRAIELARGVGAGLVVWGAYYVHGDSVRFQTQIANARNGDVVRNIAYTALPLARANTDLPRFAQHVSDAIGRYFGARLQTWPPSLRKPPAFDAYMIFHRASEHYARREFAAAIDFFAQAAAFDSSFVQARIWLARTLAEHGDAARADSIAHSLEPYRRSMTSYDAALLDHVRASCRAPAAPHSASIANQLQCAR